MQKFIENIETSNVLVKFILVVIIFLVASALQTIEYSFY